MTLSFQAVAMAMPGYFRIGRWHVPIYGLFAAAAIVLAMWASQRTARVAGLDETRLWDAGMFAVFAAFLASRLLLVVENWPAFVRFPLLVVSLPSLTYGGMALTALATVVYLRRNRIPVLTAMDAWAPCAAALAAVLSLGHFLEGTDAGMPTRLPWGVITPGDTVLGRTHPVQLYALLTSVVLGIVLYRRLTRRNRAGIVAATALLTGGAAFFLLDMLAQPYETHGNAWLDPGQWVALLSVAAGASMAVALHGGTMAVHAHPTSTEAQTAKETA